MTMEEAIKQATYKQHPYGQSWQQFDESTFTDLVENVDHLIEAKPASPPEGSEVGDLIAFSVHRDVLLNLRRIEVREEEPVPIVVPTGKKDFPTRHGEGMRSLDAQSRPRFCDFAIRQLHEREVRVVAEPDFSVGADVQCVTVGDVRTPCRQVVEPERDLP